MTPNDTQVYDETCGALLIYPDQPAEDTIDPLPVLEGER